MSSLRLCFIARTDSLHTRRWVDPFIERGDQVWAINAAARPAQRPWKGVHIIDLPAMFNAPWVRYGVWTMRAWLAVRRIRPHVLHAHNLSLAGWVAAAVNYHPLVVTVWGSDILVHPDHSRMANKLAHWVLNRADVVTAPAQSLFDRAATFTDAARVRLIHWGVDCQVFNPQGETATLRASLGLDPRAPVLLCSRGLSPIYNIETVLRALKQVLQVEPGTQLLLIDFNPDPAYRRMLDQRIKEWELQNNVRFLPRIEGQSNMAALYRLADLVISLPLSDSLSLTVLEAMACGTPVVVSDLPAYEGWVLKGKTGDAVPVHDATAAANSILSLLNTDATRVQMGQHCREMVCQRASMELQKQNSLALYQSLIAGTP